MNHKAKDKDHSVNQRLKTENQKLKRQIQKLRKQLARVDLEAYSNIREVIEAQQREDIAFEKEQISKKRDDNIRKQWECHQCGQDYLRLMLIHRPDGDYYLRKCPVCRYKTKLKPFTDNVKGLETRTT